MLKYNFMCGYTYILECSDGSYYTGSTQELTRRVWQHNNGGGANYTAKHRPVKLVYFERYNRIDAAFKREKQLQGWSRKKKEALITGNYERLKEYAACKNSTNSALRLSRIPEAASEAQDTDK